MVLLALVDAKNCFTVIKMGYFGRKNDGGVVANSHLEGKWRQKPCRCPKMYFCLGVKIWEIHNGGEYHTQWWGMLPSH